MIERLHEWKREHDLPVNIMAGLTVSFVALSLGAAFGELSGRGAFAGMLSAALIALITSMFGGTRVQCSGPTAPMTTVTAVAVAAAHDHFTGSLGISADHFVNVVILLTAVLLIISGLAGLGRFIRLVPNLVVSGFMNGIAILVWLDPIKRLFGWGGKTQYEGPVVINAVVITLTAILVFNLGKVFRRFLPRFASLLSATFIAIIIMTSVSALLALPIERVTLAAAFHSWGDVVSMVKTQLPATISLDIVKAAAPLAVQLTILAYLDTLLTSLVVDRRTGERTHQSKELVAQGVGAGVVALFGGIPGAQATIRSVLIIDEKATSRLAGILVGVFAIIEMLIFQDLINQIPQAVFAGVLVKVGWDVMDKESIGLYLRGLTKGMTSPSSAPSSDPGAEVPPVSHREMAVIVGTTLVTILWNLNAAVFLCTFLMWLHNKVRPRAPIRDLELDGEPDDGKNDGTVSEEGARGNHL